MEALDLLAEPVGLPSFDLPDELRDFYPGALGFPAECLFANFVSTIDGIVALPGVAGSNRLIADASEADRFVMGLLRACADAVVIGSGTLKGSPRAVWTAETAYPDAAASFLELRRRLGLTEQPTIAIVTSGESFPVDHPLLERHPVLLTTEAGAARLEAVLPAADVVAVSAGERVDLTAAVGVLRARGFGRILSEGGPHLFGSLLDAGLLDELFLTVSPLVAGRSTVAGSALSLCEGVSLLPGRRVASELCGVRRHGEHLFLRYRLTR
jgi:riboflavin biosynthesis pyrimidine reductase